jgi:hypothetical protein
VPRVLTAQDKFTSSSAPSACADEANLPFGPFQHLPGFANGHPSDACASEAQLSEGAQPRTQPEEIFMTKEMTNAEFALFGRIEKFVFAAAEAEGIILHPNELGAAFEDALIAMLIDARRDDVFDPPRRRWFHWLTRESRTAE